MPIHLHKVCGFFLIPKVELNISDTIWHTEPKLCNVGPFKAEADQPVSTVLGIQP